MAGKSNKRGNGRRSNKRTSKSRGPRRQLNKAVGMRLLRTNVPADPPVRALMHEHASVVRIDCVISTHAEIDYGSVLSCATAKLLKDTALKLSFNDLRLLIISHMGYRDGSDFEMNIRKISAWGSRRTTETTDLTPRLIVDLSDISGGMAITDRGAPNARPRMAVSSPFNLWVKPSETVFMSFDPQDAATAGSVGIVDISVAWRRFAM